MDQRIEGVLKFWFGSAEEGDERPTGEELWLPQTVQIGRLVERDFGALVKEAKQGALDAWAESPRGRLALILLLDSFNRKIHRESPEAFAGDAKALALCFDGLDDGVDKRLTPIERAFFYLPCAHAEDTDAQLASVEVYQELLEQTPPAQRPSIEGFVRRAHENQDVVERFERFPQRNQILDRSTTPEESTFLQHSGQLT